MIYHISTILIVRALNNNTVSESNVSSFSNSSFHVPFTSKRLIWYPNNKSSIGSSINDNVIQIHIDRLYLVAIALSFCNIMYSDTTSGTIRRTFFCLICAGISSPLNRWGLILSWIQIF